MIPLAADRQYLIPILGADVSHRLVDISQIVSRDSDTRQCSAAHTALQSTALIFSKLNLRYSFNIPANANWYKLDTDGQVDLCSHHVSQGFEILPFLHARREEVEELSHRVSVCAHLFNLILEYLCHLLDPNYTGAYTLNLEAAIFTICNGVS